MLASTRPASIFLSLTLPLLTPDTEMWDEWTRTLIDLPPVHALDASTNGEQMAFPNLLDDALLAEHALMPPPPTSEQPSSLLAPPPPHLLPVSSYGSKVVPIGLATSAPPIAASASTTTTAGKRKKISKAEEEDDDDDEEFDINDAAAAAADDDLVLPESPTAGGRAKRKRTAPAKPRGKKAAAAAAAAHDVTDDDVDAAFVQAGDKSAPKRRIVAAEANRLLSISLEHGDVTPSARESLSVVNASADQISAAIDQARAAIAQIPPVGERDEATRARAKALLDQLPELQQRVAKTRRDIDALCGQVVLRPEEFSITQHLLVSLGMHEEQLKLFERELTFLHTFQGGRMPNCLTLAIAAQPFPMSYMYRKRIQEEVVLKLLTGAHANFLIGDAKANIVAENAAAELSAKGKAKGKKAAAAAAAADDDDGAGAGGGASGGGGIDKGTATFDRDGHATFVEMSFKSGSRKMPIRLQFSAQVDDTVRPGDGAASGSRTAKLHAPFEIQSGLSEPFVVMTHENQWVETVGMLLRTALFGANGQGVVTWQRFCNVFQHHVLRTTRQDTDHPRRPLALAELSHFHLVHFGKKATIDCKSLDKFWQWFGPALNRLHFKRHLSSLWADGVIGGFMSRADAEAALQSASVGSFLIRFSDTRAGQLVISYIPAPNNAEGPIVHFLVPPHHTDERSFPDSLRDWDQFSTVLKTPTHGPGVVMQRERTYEPVPKSNLLAPYYSKKKVQSGADIGYQDNPL